MKKILILIGVALATVINAQTNLNTVAHDAITNSQAFLIDHPGFLSSENLFVSPYVTYAPDIKANDKVGGGVFISSQITDISGAKVGAGIGVDWLGQLTMPSGNLTLKADIKPLAFIGLTNFVVTPFALAGIAVPLGGAGTDNGSPCTIATAGAFTSVGKVLHRDSYVGAAWSKWNNAGDYSGGRLEFFFTLKTK